MLIVYLPEQSWFGDYQILLKRETTFQVEAGEPNKDKSTSHNHFVQVYKMNGKTLLEILADYPVFNRFLLLRATHRRSQFM